MKTSGQHKIMLFGRSDLAGTVVQHLGRDDLKVEAIEGDHQHQRQQQDRKRRQPELFAPAGQNADTA